MVKEEIFSKLINKKYKTIVIDPPWNHKKTGLRKVRPQQGRKFPYKTMSIENIKSLDINKLAKNNSIIFLWAVDKYLEEAHDVLRIWGFKKHCIFVWNKNTGVCPFSVQFRNEFCLMGYKGKLNLKKIGLPTHFYAKVREHSRKPDEFYDIVRKITGYPRVDIFSREKRRGFDQWGDEISKFSK